MIYFLFFLGSQIYLFCTPLDFVNVASKRQDEIDTKRDINSILGEEENPFLFESLQQAPTTDSDWLALQNRLRKIDLKPLLEKYYPANQGYTTFDDFLQRCSRGIRQTLICPEKGYFPEKHLQKIGQGSDLCIVSYASFDNYYADFIEANAIALESVGFNGYYLYYKGGFPNPTGREIELAGVPYSFKVGMLLEAKNLGFNKVLWIDSAVQPLRDPTPLFEWIEKTGAFLFEEVPFATLWRYILPNTSELIQKLTGVNILQERYIWAAIFGLKLDTPEASSFIDTFYQFAALGLPFLSCFPEQYVFSAIIGQNEYKKWIKAPFSRLLFQSHEHPPGMQLSEIKKQGYYFYLRGH